MEIGALPRDVGGDKVPLVPCGFQSLIYTSALRLMQRGLSPERDNVLCIDVQASVQPTFRIKAAADALYSVSTTLGLMSDA